MRKEGLGVRKVEENNGETVKNSEHACVGWHRHPSLLPLVPSWRNFSYNTLYRGHALGITSTVPQYPLPSSLSWTHLIPLEHTWCIHLYRIRMKESVIVVGIKMHFLVNLFTKKYRRRFSENQWQLWSFYWGYHPVLRNCKIKPHISMTPPIDASKRGFYRTSYYNGAS